VVFKRHLEVEVHCTPGCDQEDHDEFTEIWNRRPSPSNIVKALFFPQSIVDFPKGYRNFTIFAKIYDL
jgi:hypothetical protein